LRRCLECNSTWASRTWVCPACGFEPKAVGGFLSFAPEAAVDNADYDPGHFATLVAIEDNSFWFEGRNRIILWAISRFLPAGSPTLTGGVGTDSLMEIGVGTGFVLRALCRAMPGARFTATDVHVEGLRFAATRVGPSVDLLQMDARHIPFTAEFDIVCMFDVLEHIQEDDAVLKEIGRTLKPRGGVVITVPQHMFLWGPFDEAGFHKRRYGIHELEQKVRAAGLEVLFKTSFISLLLPFLYISRLRSRKQPSSDLAGDLVLPWGVNGVFRAVLKLELLLIRLGIRFPMGGSQLLVARASGVE
jgi:SAM-dependent methyltransferase